MVTDDVIKVYYKGQEIYRRRSMALMVAEVEVLREQNAQLLEALKYIMNWTPDKWNPETARDLARAAIAAAEGKE